MIKLPAAVRKVLGTHGEPAAHPLAAPLIVTGCMRSGTTFLVDKLTSHPQLLKVGVELNEVWTQIGGAPIKGRCTHRTAEDASPAYAYQMARYFADFIGESKSFKRKAMRFYAKLYHGLGRTNYDWDHIIPVNKSPHLMNKLGYTGALFPGATLILIIRDIYSHSASMKVHFDQLYKAHGRTYFLEEAPGSCYSQTEGALHDNARAYPGDFSIIPEMWMRMNALAIKEFEESGFAHKVVLSYERLITQQDQQLRALFEHLQLRPEHAAEAERIAQKATPLVNTTTSGNPLQKWKKQLSEGEVAAIDGVLKENETAYRAIQEFVAKHAL